MAMADEEDIAVGGTVVQVRRKGAGVKSKTWLVISESGEMRLEEVGKHSIMRRTGLPARDLRMLDPILSYPSSILGRERAIVINMEHIKAIITAKEVLMLNSTNPLVVQFVHDLRYRISSPPQQAMERDGIDMDNTTEAIWVSPSLHDHHDHHDSADSLRNRSSQSNRASAETKTTAGVALKAPADVSVATGPKVLPFEFRALEACLESACRCLESETRTLEEEAYPALDELTSKVSTLNLERVRQIKSRLVAISGRVQKVRDELEHLLDDDNDMAEMYLTEKLISQALDQTSTEDIDTAAVEEDQKRRDICSTPPA